MRVKKEINIQIGEQIKIAREQAHFTQEQLAESIEVSPQYISDLERGVVGLSIPTLKKLCITLCISSDQILFAKKTTDNVSIIAEKCSTLSEYQRALLFEIIDRYILALGDEKHPNK